jgi:hypothetical protein
VNNTCEVDPPAGGSRENFPYEFKAGPAGGRLRRPSSAGDDLGEAIQEDIAT